MAKFKFIFEDLPSEDNFIATSEDPLKPIVSFKGPSKYALNGINSLASKFESLFSMLPVERIHFENRPTPTESHILATTPMGTTSSNGVVDKDLIHFKYRNVFVLGGSVFPTISPSNPTLTLSALSLMAADRSF